MPSYLHKPLIIRPLTLLLIGLALTTVLYFGYKKLYTTYVRPAQVALTETGNVGCVYNFSLKSNSSPIPATSAQTDSSLVTQTVCSLTSADIVIALDRSASMNTRVDSKLKLDWEKEAAIAFVSSLKANAEATKDKVRVGVVSWAGDNAKVTSLPLTSDYDQVITWINAIKYDPTDLYTCIDCAISQISNLLLGSTARTYAILMSDGVGNRIVSGSSPTPPACTNNQPLGPYCPRANTESLSRVSALKQAGVVFHVVGYGTPTTMLEDQLKSMSSGEGHYHYAPKESQWQETFRQITPQICEEINP